MSLELASSILQNRQYVHIRMKSHSCMLGRGGRGGKLAVDVANGNCAGVLTVTVFGIRRKT